MARKTKSGGKIKTRRQNPYFQKGCSKSRVRNLRGGRELLGLRGGPVLGLRGGSALVGSPWTPNVSSWPGVGGYDGQTNYYNLNKYAPFDPQQNIIQERMSGGGRRRKTKRHRRRGKRSTRHYQRGGFPLVPQDVTNFGSTMLYGLGSAYNGLVGTQQPVSPLPYQDQLPGGLNLNTANLYSYYSNSI
jgi:hypothetical protein